MGLRYPRYQQSDPLRALLRRELSTGKPTASRSGHDRNIPHRIIRSTGVSASCEPLLHTESGRDTTTIKYTSLPTGPMELVPAMTKPFPRCPSNRQHNRGREPCPFSPDSVRGDSSRVTRVPYSTASIEWLLQQHTNLNIRLFNHLRAYPENISLYGEVEKVRILVAQLLTGPLFQYSFAT